MNGETMNSENRKMSWVDALNHHEQSREPYVIATVIKAESPSSAKPGDKAIISVDGVIFGWIGGGCAQPVITKAVTDVLASGQPMVVRISPSTGETVTENGVRDVHMACHSGGSLELLVEPRLHQEVTLLIGATPVAEKLEMIAPLLGFPMARYEPGDEVDGSFSIAIVASQGKKDKESLKQALRNTLGNVLFVASRRKAEKLNDQLLSDGVSASDLKRICAPAGVDIDAETTDEIVISLLAGLVKDKRHASRVVTSLTGEVA
jgi:xanthine dehydrogenase accessory factor